MIEEIVIGGYAVAGLYFARRVAGAVLWMDVPVDEEPEGDDKGWALACGFATLVIWPIIVVGIGWQRHAHQLVVMPAQTKTKRDAYKRKELERSVGLAERSYKPRDTDMVVRDNDSDWPRY